MAKSANVLETLKGLDVGEIDAELERIQGQVAELQESADKLKAVRKAVDLAVNGKPPRAPRGSKKKPQAKQAAAASPAITTTGGLANRIHEYLLHAGIGSVGAIASALSVEPEKVSACCKNHPAVFQWAPRNGGYQLRRDDG